MSGIKAKDLSHNREEPAFLQRLKAQYGGDRHNVQIARPKKDRLKTGDADEDEPTIVDELGETVAKTDWEERLQRRHQDGEDKVQSSTDIDGVSHESRKDVEAEEAREKQKVADIGTAKKRKAVKVVADEDEVDQNEGREATSKDDVHGPTTDSQSRTPTTPKPKKKGKKIKLSFDDPD